MVTSAPRKLHDRSPVRGQGGFTLIEVMVVVLIIGILLSVGIPTFLGAQTRGHDTAARSNLATAATAASVMSEFGADFSQATPDALAAFEPSLTYVDAGMASTGASEISVDASTPGEWTATVQSDSGACFGVELTAQGRSFFEPATCGAGLAGPPIPPAPTNLARNATTSAAGGRDAQLATDGDMSTLGRTGWLGEQWFSFDLGSSSAIDQIVLWNRTDCCANRTRDLTIIVSDSPISTNKRDATASGAPTFSHPGAVGSPSTMSLNTTGRYIMIFGSGPNTAFQEVEILGTSS